MGLAGGVNTYGYVGGNPVNYLDPTGESTTTIGGYIGGLCGGPVGAGIGATIGSLIGVGIYYYFADDCGGGGGGSSSGDGKNTCEKEDKCKEIIEKIQEVMKELFRRYNHLCRNKRNTWASHVPAFEGKKTQLRKLVNEAESMGCEVPPKAYEWLTAQCPAPGTQIGDNPSPGY